MRHVHITIPGAKDHLRALAAREIRRHYPGAAIFYQNLDHSICVVHGAENASHEQTAFLLNLFGPQILKCPFMRRWTAWDRIIDGVKSMPADPKPLNIAPECDKMMAKLERIAGIPQETK